MLQSPVSQRKVIHFPKEILPKLQSNNFNFCYILQNIVCNFVYDFIFTEQNNQVYEYNFSLSGKKYLLTKTDDELAKLLAGFEFCTDFSFELGLTRKNYSGLFYFKFYPETSAKIEDFKLIFECRLDFNQHNFKLFSKLLPFVAMYDYKNLSEYLLDKVNEMVKLKIANLSRLNLSVNSDFYRSLNIDMFKDLKLSLNELEILLLLFYVYDEKSKYSLSKNIIFSVDDILRLKNTPVAKNSNGKKGGYQEIYRKYVDGIIAKLSDLKNEFCDKYFYISKFHYLSKGKSKFYYFFSPSDIFLEKFEDRHNFVLYNSQIFRYHHNKEKFEKFLGFYFSKGKISKPLLVEDLVLQVFDRQEICRPNIVREKFENAMDKLVENSILKSWEYKNINEAGLEKKYWFEDWLKLELKVVKILG